MTSLSGASKKLTQLVTCSLLIHEPLESVVENRGSDGVD